MGTEETRNAMLPSLSLLPLTIEYLQLNFDVNVDWEYQVRTMFLSEFIEQLLILES